MQRQIAAAQDPEQFELDNNGNIRQNSLESEDDTKSVAETILGCYDEPILLTQTTHSFLFSEPTRSVPFIFALGVITVSYTCLILALLNNLLDGTSPGNLLNAPVNVGRDVKIAQYLALLIGLIMEEEIPQSLYLLRNVSEKTLHNKAPYVKFDRFVLCAVLRIIMGYLFYFNMFVVVVQATAVIEIFFDVLALQFLQQIDDICFTLCKMDVFGKSMKCASMRKCFRAEFEKMPYFRRKKMTLFVKVLYIVNFSALMMGMAVISIRQGKGMFQCRSITVAFGDEIWEGALVINATGGVGNDDMALIYSYFNGVYKKTGIHDGRPMYTEVNKFDGEHYEEKAGAIVKYCHQEKAWVFMHPNLRKDINTADSYCPWLLRSPQTDSFNLLEVSGDWSIWTGTISKTAAFQTTCNGCETNAECNYHGECILGQCACGRSSDDGRPLHTGTHCEFSRPCAQIIGDDGDLWDIRLIDGNGVSRAYGRGLYYYRSGGGVTIDPADTLQLIYSGSRWFAAVFENSADKPIEFWMMFCTELHPFWDKLYQDNAHAISNPTTRSDPIAVDFFRIGQRGEKYGPLGELLPAQDPPGSGYFQCTRTGTDFVEKLLASGSMFGVP